MLIYFLGATTFRKPTLDRKKRSHDMPNYPASSSLCPFWMRNELYSLGEQLECLNMNPNLNNNAIDWKSNELIA
jgi:hypothetical protein